LDIWLAGSSPAVQRNCILGACFRRHRVFPQGRLREPGEAAMNENDAKYRHRWLLDPVDRISEILFGLFMAVTIVGSLSIANAGRNEVRTVLAAALGFAHRHTCDAVVAGFALGRHTWHSHPTRPGIGMTLLGIALIAAVKALGG
jgi:hypothetical protein